MKTPMISVVMPVYNGEKYLREAIDSILNQTYRDFEFIILNDGSTDKTEEIVLSYTDPRIVYVKNEENLQIVKTLNKGIGLARGKYIARMDADDISVAERFEKQLRFMEENPDIGVCGTWLETFGAKKHIWRYPVLHEEIKTALLFNSSLGHPSVMIKKEFFNYCLYQEKYNKAEDYALWAEGIDKVKFHNLPEILLLYRLHENQTDLNHQQSVANQIRYHMLIQMSCNLEESYLNLFYKIISCDNISDEELSHTSTLLQKIYYANFSTHYLKQKILVQYLDSYICCPVKKILFYSNFFNIYRNKSFYFLLFRCLKQKIMKFKSK